MITSRPPGCRERQDDPCACDAGPRPRSGRAHAGYPCDVSSDDPQIVGLGGIPSAEQFGTPTVRTSRPEEWLEVGLRGARERLRVALQLNSTDAVTVFPSLYEVLAWSITLADVRGITGPLRTAVEFVRDGVIHGTLDLAEPHGEPTVWHWRASHHFHPPTDKLRLKTWLRKQEAYDDQLAGKPVAEGVDSLIKELLP